MALVLFGALAGGIFAARGYCRWLAGRATPRTVLVAAVTVWSILVGLAPFGVFGLLVMAGWRPELGSAERLAANLLPFAAVTSPLVGYLHGVSLGSRIHRENR